MSAAASQRGLLRSASTGVRRLSPKLALLAFVTTSTFLVAELVVRQRHHAWPFEHPAYVPEHLAARDVPLRWRYPPADGRNRLGLRNREVLPKTRGTYRVLFLGDSVIWSGETSAGGLYTEVLERRLAASPPAGYGSLEVVNAGVPGYTTFQELQFLRIYGLEMEPDLVVLGFVFNDLYHPYLHRPSKGKLLDLDPATRLQRFDPEAFPGRLFARSHLAHEVFRRGGNLWRKVTGRPAFPFEWRDDLYLAWKEHGWRDTRRSIGEMRAVLDERNVPLVVLVFPVSDQVDDRYRKLDEAYVSTLSAVSLRSATRCPFQAST